jgi:adenylate kinase
LGKITPNLLPELLKWKMQDIPCRNQGFVLDGIPSNYNFAEALIAVGLPPPHIFVDVDASDVFLRERAPENLSLLLGRMNLEEFDVRMQQNRTTNWGDNGHLFFVFDPLVIRSVTFNIETTNEIMIAIAAFIGRSHNFGKAPSVILRD